MQPSVVYIFQKKLPHSVEVSLPVPSRFLQSRIPYGVPTQVKGQNLNHLREVIDFKSYFSLSNETPNFIPLFKALGNLYLPPFAKTPFGFVRPNSEGPIMVSPFLRNPLW